MINSRGQMAGLARATPEVAERAAPHVPLHDCRPPIDDLSVMVLGGLRARPKRLPCKLLYDAAGSRLFERICTSDEYYPTRTELTILRRFAGEIATTLGTGCRLIEYGCGSGLKTRLLLGALQDPAAYVPIDIARDALLEAAGLLASEFPELPVRPVWADYQRPFTLPAEASGPPRRRTAFFPGSTIGNFEPREAVRFLACMAARHGRGSGLLIGVDLKKDPRVLHAAYNDAAGVTAAFNRNLLVRLNRELGADFNVEAFDHYAPYNPARGRIEMHLVARGAQRVQLGRDVIAFADGESIHTENSYKYTIGGFARLARLAGYRLLRTWVDDGRLFSVHFLRAA